MLDTDAVAVIVVVPKTWPICASTGCDVAAEAGNGGLGKKKAPRAEEDLEHLILKDVSDI